MNTLDEKKENLIKEEDLSIIGGVTIRFICDYLGVSKKTVLRWDANGSLKPRGRTVSGWRYYLFSDVEKIFQDITKKEGK